jgi:hypothetical protein
VAMSKENKKRHYRVVSFLKREELDFLDELAKDIYFSHGINIPRTKLIEEIIEAFRQSEDLSRKEMEENLIKRFKDGPGSNR